MAGEVRSFMERFYDAYNRGDFDSWAEFMNNDVETIAPQGPGQARVQGPMPFVEYAKNYKRSSPDSRIDIGSVVESGDTGAVEGVYSGTNTGPMASPQGEIPATGRSFELPFCALVQLRGGKLSSHHVYFDQVSLMGQLGLIPEPQGAA